MVSTDVLSESLTWTVFLLLVFYHSNVPCESRKSGVVNQQVEGTYRTLPTQLHGLNFSRFCHGEITNLNAFYFFVELSYNTQTQYTVEKCEIS